MMRRVLTIALLGFLVTPLAAQAPEGLRVRIDRSADAQDPDDTPDLKVVAVGKGFRVTGGPAGTFWNPAQTATGNYTARATFTLIQPSPHVNYYGLVIGGSALEGAGQTYLYFIIAQNGAYQVRHRTGEAVHTLQGPAPHTAIRQPDANGQSTNAMEVRVAGDMISYVVTGAVVHTTPKAGIRTDGIVGARVNHLLDVQVDGLEVQRH
jgi:hypothetical protein